MKVGAARGLRESILRKGMTPGQKEVDRKRSWHGKRVTAQAHKGGWRERRW